MPGHGEKYERLKDRAVLAVLSHPTLPEAAKAVGVATRTLLRWMQRPDFQEALRTARREALRHALGQLQTAMGEAVETLREVMRDPEAAPGARVSAARTVLESALRAVEVDELDARLAALEAELTRRSAA